MDDGVAHNISHQHVLGDCTYRCTFIRYLTKNEVTELPNFDEQEQWMFLRTSKDEWRSRVPDTETSKHRPKVQ